MACAATQSGFHSSSLATLPLGLSFGFGSTSACGPPSGICSPTRQEGTKVAADLGTFRPESDNIQPWHIPFPIWNQSVVPCPVLTVASWPAYWFLKRQVRWSGIPISFRIFHSLLWSTQSKALAWSIIRNRCFSGTLLLFDDPADVGNLISGSSAFSKTGLNPGLEEAQLESRLPGEISITSDMQMTPPLWQKVKRN